MFKRGLPFMMTMNAEKLIGLIRKYEDGTISSQEKKMLESWYIQQAKESKHQLSEADIEASFKHLKAQLPVKTSKTVKLWPRIAVASAIAFFVIGAYFFSATFTKTDGDNKALVAADIAPGKNGATLTLANGQKIFINDALAGNIASQSGVKISKTSGGQLIYELTNQKGDKTEYNTLTTTRGEQTQVRLPDGSLVFLNAASSLRYPTSFARAGERRVRLTGEGYFEVAKNKAQPFVVSTVNQEVHVLGTHFNINAYSDEKSVRTTLMEGAVKVTPVLADGTVVAIAKARVLKPGQQSVMDGKGIQVAEVDLSEAMAWQKGYFSFYDEDIAAVMRKVSRWYNVEVEYAGALPEVGFNARIDRYSNIKDVLKILEKSKTVHFKIEGRKVIISK
jgi:transmembrane sensor